MGVGNVALGTDGIACDALLCEGDRMKKTIIWLVVLVILSVVALVLVGCESADNAAARRANAEAQVIQANTEAANERAANRMAQAEQGHRHFQENMPIIFIVAGAMVMVPFLACVAWWMIREQSIRQQQMMILSQQPQLPAPYTYYPPVRVSGPIPPYLLERLPEGKEIIIYHQ